MTQPAFLAAVDWSLVAYAAGMGALMSLLMTWRTRNAQKARDLPLSPWTTLIPDTLIAMVTATLGTLGITAKFPALRTFEGVGLVAAALAVLGPQLWDVITTSGKDAVLTWAAKSLGGPLQALADAAKRKGGPPDDPDATP